MTGEDENRVREAMDDVEEKMIQGMGSRKEIKDKPRPEAKPSTKPTGARVQNQVLAVNPKNDGGSFESNSQRQKRRQLTCDMTACLPEPKHLVTVYQDYHVFLAISGIDSVNQINFGYPLGHALSKFEKLALTCIISRITTPHVPPPFAVEPSLTDRHKRYHDDPKVENLDDDDVRVASRLTRSVGAD
ncbi:hypothetical protein FOIG_12604 [Fusarium odoratissimum NRRL 54006]|uniref:Uncharacterized protein n=1 Tax=Fusarium odoratissimum (strain NRRL 54006) TaxID=1089451 RepID=X0JEE8_FUSO5|nr:uncharacterized protein FOIG_12604 [Fusarium odoratissimum NRRL 54006]EXL94761.1 hypothetical protein FOIG_12604 [Fusarium odoratissimum NRRL 54006]